MLNPGLIGLRILWLTNDCPKFVKAQVAKAQRYAEHPQEPIFEEDVDDDAVEAEEQPDWVDVYGGQNQIYEGVERDFNYDDGGEEYDWSSTCVILPERKDPKKWLQESIKESEEQETETGELELPEVSLLSLNENQRAIVSLVFRTLYNYVGRPARLPSSATCCFWHCWNWKVLCYQVPSEVSAAVVRIQ